MPSFPNLWGYTAKSTPTTATSRHQSIDLRNDRADREWEDLSTPTGRRSEEQNSDADVQSLEGSRTREDFLAEKREVAELRERCAELKKQNESLTRKMDKATADADRLRGDRARREADHKEELRRRDAECEELKRRDAMSKAAVDEVNSARASAEEEGRKLSDKINKYKKQHADDQAYISTLIDGSKAAEAHKEGLMKQDEEHTEELKKRDGEYKEGLKRQDAEHKEELRKRDWEYGEELKKRDWKYAEELKKQDREHSEELKRRDSTHKVAVGELNTARATAEDECQRLSEKLARYRKRYEDNQAYIASVLDETKTMERRAREAEKHTAALEEALHSANESVVAWKREADRQAQDAKALRDERAHTKKQFDQVLSLLDVRSAELKGAQSFLTIADAATGTQIIDSLRRLNNEIMQVAAFLAEATLEKFEFAFGAAGSGAGAVSAEERTFAMQRVTSILGAKMVEHLGTKNHADEPILLQIAFQAYLARMFEWIIGSWIIGDASLNSFLDALYSQVKTTVFGKWRAMTRAHLLASQPDRARALAQISATMLDGLAHILLAARCATPPADVKKALAEKYTQRFALVAGLALDVNRVLGEDVTSSEYEVVVVKSGAAFDSAEMEDAYDDGQPRGASRERAPAARVLCATDLGLAQHTKLSGGKDGKWDSKVLLKSKVALESVVDFMDE